MSELLDLVRPGLRGFSGYKSARSDDLRGEIWLNANESAWVNAADVNNAGTDGAGLQCRRYPDPQPVALRDALADLYGCASEQLLIGRGSDEAIDLLVRALCVPGEDAVVVTPPVFGMYAVSARLQGAALVEVPLVDGDGGFAPDLAAVAQAALSRQAKLVFLCSPSNPTGGAIALSAIAELATRLQGKALLVVDEAYGEFSDQPSAISVMPWHPNLAVLRTLSKAHALAAARIGCVVSDPALIAVLRACQAPYPIPAPCSALALAALGTQALVETRRHVEIVKSERDRMMHALAALPGISRVYPSQANFLLARFKDAERAYRAVLAAGIVVRDQRAASQLADALRITIGTPEQNKRVLETLRALEKPA